MAHGQPDFWSAITPKQSIFGEGQVSWLIAEDGDVAAGSFTDLGLYTVPAHYELHICGGAIGCSKAGINRFVVTVMGLPLGLGYFDTQINLGLDPAAAYVIPSGYIITFRVYNDGIVDNHVAILGLGFLARVA